MFRRDLIIVIWFMIPLVLHFLNISIIDSRKEVIWLISDTIIIILLILPETFRPNQKLAKWLTKRVLF